MAQINESLWQKLRDGDYRGALLGAHEKFSSIDLFDLAHLTGIALLKLGELEAGANWVSATISLSDAAAQVYEQSVIALRDAGILDYALVIADHGIERHPDAPMIPFVKGLVLIDANQSEAAVELFKQLYARFPDFHGIKQPWAAALTLLNRPAEARALLESMPPGTPEINDDVANGIAWTHQLERNHEAALAIWNDRCPKSARNVYNASLSELALGLWPLAWEHHRRRHIATAVTQSPFYKLDLPVAERAEDLTGQRVLFYSEQGYGDTIQFCRYALRIAQHARSLTILTPPPLVRLLTTLPVNNVTVTSDVPRRGTIDVSLPMLDAPWVFQTTLETVPAPIPYFTVPPRNPRPIPWSGRLHVGLLWSGAARFHDRTSFAIDRRRSIPFAKFARFLELSDMFEFVSLQLPDGGKNVVDDPRLREPLRDGFDFLDTAAVVDQLDLVIAVDSAIAHLAGALGKTTWLLNRFDGCWRWLADGRTTSPWYPTMRLFHQQEPGNWDKVIDEVYSALTTYFME